MYLFLVDLNGAPGENPQSGGLRAGGGGQRLGQAQQVGVGADVLVSVDVLRAAQRPQVHDPVRVLLSFGQIAQSRGQLVGVGAHPHVRVLDAGGVVVVGAVDAPDLLTLFVQLSADRFRDRFLLVHEDQPMQ